MMMIFHSSSSPSPSSPSSSSSLFKFALPSSASSSSSSLSMFFPLLLFVCLAMSTTVTGAPYDPFEFGSVLPSSSSSIQDESSFLHGASSSSATSSSSASFPLYALQRRSFPSPYANRRSAHPCRWKLCGAYHNYSSLRRFF